MTSAPNQLHAYLRSIRQNRSSSFFRLTDVLQAEQRRMGLESILEKGLLHEILQHLDLGDLVKLARTCKFFNTQISDIFTKKVHTCLKPFINDIPSMLCLVNALNALISGRVILDILFGRKQVEGEHQMTLCVDDAIAADAFVNHHTSTEGYRDAQTLIVDMSDAIYQGANPDPLAEVNENQGVLGSEQGGLTTMKRIQSLQKNGKNSRIFVDVYNFEVDGALSIEEASDRRKETAWLIQDVWTTCLINAMSMNRLTVYYPYSTLYYLKTERLRNTVPDRYLIGQGYTPFHSEEILQSVYGIPSEESFGFETETYYDKVKPCRPASVDRRRAGLKDGSLVQAHHIFREHLSTCGVSECLSGNTLKQRMQAHAHTFSRVVNGYP